MDERAEEADFTGMKTVDAILCTLGLALAVLIGLSVMTVFKAAVDAPFITQQEARAD